MVRFWIILEIEAMEFDDGVRFESEEEARRYFT